MKAKAKIVSNLEEIDQARRLEMPIPKVEFNDVDFYFDMNFVGYAYNYPKDQIQARIYGMDVRLVYEEDLMKAFIDHLDRKKY